MEMIDLCPPRQEVRQSTDEERVSLSISNNHDGEDLFSPSNQSEEDGILSNQDVICGRDENDFAPPEKALLLKWYNHMTVLLWRLGELHMAKVISFTLISVVLAKVNIQL